MLFTSFTFFIFLAVVLVLYYAIPKKFRWIILLLGSYFFYIYFSWKFLFFILFTTITTYFGARYITKVNARERQHLADNPEISPEDKAAMKAKNKNNRKTALVLTILSNVLVLFLLKYLNFFIENLNGIFSWFSTDLSISTLSIILPLGISFYTFIALGYLIDVYWGKHDSEKNIFKFALFLSFFPQILQGPISRHSETGAQLVEGHKFDYQNFVYGVQRILWGLFKKLVIADYLAGPVESMFGGYESMNGLQVSFGVVAYFIQDYADFSGCMDIALGVAQCMGVKLPENFRRPYFAITIEEYWRRWHITLGSWFKDYIFYPLSTSKFSLKLGKASKKVFGSTFGKSIPAIFGLIIVWFTTGLWHGASWNYIVWGLYFGLLIILSIVFKPLTTKIHKALKIDPSKWWYKAFQWIRTIGLLLIGRIIFRAETLADSWNIFIKSFDIFRFDYLAESVLDLGIDLNTLIIVAAAIVVLLVVDLIQEKRPQTSMRDKVASLHISLRWTLYLGLLLVVVLLGAWGVSTSATDFQYMQF